jgi:hypothetical protein
MKITISQIFKRGVPSEERLVLKVLTDSNLTYYVVLDTVYSTPTTISPVPKHTFWFRSKPVKAGDTVVLYTKMGEPSERKLDDGTTAHFFYWNQKGPLWDKTGNCAVVMELNTWATSKYE